MSKFEQGQVVFIPKSSNSVWAGKAVVRTQFEDGYVSVQMETGAKTGSIGAFHPSHIELTPPMTILKVKRSNQKTGLKVYGELQGESGKVYKFAYFRRANFRGWLCTCENFILSKFAKRQNCKHLKFVRAEIGRYASSVN